MIKKIALIGCGKIFTKHYEAIKILEKKKKLKLVAVCDENIKKINKFKIKHLNKYSKISDLLKNEKVDIITILTPSGMHFKNAMQVAGKVSSVIIEKPVALKLTDAQKMINIFKIKKTKIFVVLQNRFNKPIVKLKEAIDSKKLGNIFMVTVRLRWSRDLKYYSQAKWRGTWKSDGGVVANQSAHFLDLLQWFFGMPENIFSRIRQIHKVKEVEDTAVAILEYKEKKKIGLIEMTNAIRPKNLEGSISVLGTKGSVVVGGMSANKLVSWKVNNISQKKEENILKDLNSPDYTSHYKFYDYVVKTLNKKSNKNFLNGEEGIKSLKLINSIYASSKSKNILEIKKVKDTFLGTNTKKIF